MNTRKIWFVTGASKGLGLTLVNQLLAQGQLVAATSRSLEELSSAVQGATPENFLPLSVDIVSEKSVSVAVAATVARFGGVDVVVNNAGYGLLGSLEELTDAESRTNFDVNVFGTLNVIRQAMPHLRKQQSGHIFNISSIGGFYGKFPGWGIYCATKFAVQGLTESLAAEIEAFGIKATVVSPGYFRTNFLAAGGVVTPQNQLEAYAAVRESERVHQESINGNQPGDPEKGVALIIEAAFNENPPLHLFLGQDAYDMAYAKIGQIKSDLESWKEKTTATGF